MMKEKLFVVDMVNGFVKEGAMHDEKIMRIVPGIIELCETMEDVTFIADTHEENCIEFKSFPSHCVKGTSEAEIIDELKPYVKELIQKNSTNTFHAIDKASLEGYDKFVLVGCCSDICVMQFALTLKTYLNHVDHPAEVWVPSDCIATYDAPYHPASQYHDMAVNMMSQAGINTKAVKE